MSLIGGNPLVDKRDLSDPVVGARAKETVSLFGAEWMRFHHTGQRRLGRATAHLTRAVYAHGSSDSDAALAHAPKTEADLVSDEEKSAEAVAGGD